MRGRFSALNASVILLALACSESTRAADALPPYDKAMLPLLNKYCIKCHGKDSPEGDIDISAYKDLAAIQKKPVIWQKILTAIREREMPPPKKEQPRQAERDKMVDWLSHALNSIADSNIPKDPGYVVFHRLSRTEYNNTVRDLLGVNTRPADNFPADGGGGGGFDNNADTLFVQPVLMERYLQTARELIDATDPKRLFIEKPSPSAPKREAAQKNLRALATKAFRRPVEVAEMERYLKLFDKADKEGKSFEDATKLAMRAILVSPHFLYRVEVETGIEAHRVTDYELATRLSYFLWSSMPDDELFALAAKNQLREPAVLEKQVARMMADPKSKSLAENFGAQWLGVANLAVTAQPDRRRYPTFTDTLRDAMYQETVEFISALFRENRSLLDLISCDHTYVNEELAKHYGIPDVTGKEIRKVKLPDANRGGVISMAAVLTHTSYPLRTSPVLRGKWVLEEILGTPPPPPPPSAGVLPQDDAPKEGKTFRQSLELHRSKPECASCHARMDPIGFGLENFDAIGRWRKEIQKLPVDASGVLTSGEKFNGAGELKKVLMARKDDFVRTITEKMMAYALGRGLEYFDQPTLRGICKTVVAKDHKALTLITEIAKSYPFQYRRSLGEDEKAAAKPAEPAKK